MNLKGSAAQFGSSTFDDSLSQEDFNRKYGWSKKCGFISLFDRFLFFILRKNYVSRFGKRVTY